MAKYDDDEEVFTCVCGSYHYLQVNRSDWNGKYDYWLAFVQFPKSFRERLSIIKSAFTGKTVYHGDIHGVDVEKLIRVLQANPKRKP